MYAPVCAACERCLKSAILLFPRFLTIRTNPPEKDIVSGERKAMTLRDVFLQAGHIFHIHIENPAAFLTPHMAMLLNPVVKAIRSARNFHFANFTCFRQQLQIPIYRCPACILQAKQISRRQRRNNRTYLSLKCVSSIQSTALR